MSARLMFEITKRSGLKPTPHQPECLQLSTVNCQLSTVNCQLSTINCQLFNSQLLKLRGKST
ncbi:MAG: hypothetical protein HC849_14230 [Oscillatoriales cyanobacterium RU_3_3]|nr:hypothetical protein [Oscillatoriales cyanobacterium RU_3_3]